MLSIGKADYENGFKISMQFSDGKVGVVDLEDFIFNSKIKPFERLKDLEKFKKFDVDYTLKWNDDLDLAPEYLYFKAFEHESSLQAKFKEWGYADK